MSGRDVNGLTESQRFALIFETESARQLLAFSVTTLRTTPLLEAVQDVVLTTASIGVEKLLKLALGLAQLGPGVGWPSKDTMKNQWGHGSKAMAELLRGHLGKWLDSNPRASFVHTLVDDVDADAVWPALLDALDAYGRSARFYNLDVLAESLPAWESPRHMWEATEQVAVDQHPEIKALYGAPTERLAEMPAALNRAVADSLLRWWRMVAGSARHGVFGQPGVQHLGFGAHPRDL